MSPAVSSGELASGELASGETTVNPWGLRLKTSLVMASPARNRVGGRLLARTLVSSVTVWIQRCPYAHSTRSCSSYVPIGAWLCKPLHTGSARQRYPPVAPKGIRRRGKTNTTEVLDSICMGWIPKLWFPGIWKWKHLYWQTWQTYGAGASDQRNELRADLRPTAWPCLLWKISIWKHPLDSCLLLG